MNLSLIFNNFFLQLFYFVLLIGVVGYAISLLNRVFYKLIGDSRTACYATGFLGTPIHELSHAAMCLLFFHRIEEIRLFRIGDDGVLGYVNHSYNSRNVYQRIGNYFIGVAPILCGGAVLFLVMPYLAPSLYLLFDGYVEDFAYLQLQGFGLAEFFAYAFVVMRGMLAALFTFRADGIGLWIFYILALCIALHMNLSGADIKGALPALVPLVPALLIVNLALGILVPATYDVFGALVHMLGGYLTGMLLIALAFSVVAVIVAALVRVVMTVFRRR